jgi:hypothetical protein
MTNHSFDRDGGMDHVHNAAHLRKILETTEHWPDVVYGDTVGGMSFNAKENDILIAAEKKNRPHLACGWRSVWYQLQCWTIINCQPETADEIAELAEALESDKAEPV